MDHLLQKSQGLLPLPQLIVKLGDAQLSPPEIARGAVIRSPLREDRNPSFSIYNRGGKWRWSDKGNGDGGDEVDYIARRDGLSNPDARAKYLALAGVAGRDGPAAAKPTAKAGGGITFQAGKPQREPGAAMRPNPVAPERKQGAIVVTASPFSWETCQKAMGEAEVRSVAEWRGLTPEFVTWARDQGWIGWHKGAVAFPVHDKAGKVVSCHYRTDDGWRYPKDSKPSALVLGDPTKAGFLVLMESQWDALAALQAMDAHRNPTALAMLSFAISRGASNAALLAAPVKAAVDAGKRVAAFEQNDPEPEDGEKPYGNFIWAPAVAKLTRGICFAAPPAGVKDANDWLKAGMTGADFLDRMMESRPKRTTTLSVRNAAELWEMKFDESDNYIADRMMAAGSLCSFIGPGGIGKSRIVLQMAACCILGREFLGLVTRARSKKWLFLQTENSNRRLQSDLKNLVAGLQLNDSERRLLFRCLDFHTVEHDEDGFINMEDPECAANVEAAIFDSDPDIVVVDPLNTFTSEDLNSDRPMAAVITKLVQAIKKGNPNRVPFIIHHSITGRAGAQKAVGWDKSSYGRNSKVLYGRVRSQWNLGKVDPDDDNRLVLACGKNNDGAAFEEIGVRVTESPAFYTIDQEYDRDEYRESIGADTGKKRVVAYSVDDILRNMISGEAIRVGSLQRKCREECGISESQFYRIWNSIKDTSRVFKNEKNEYQKP